MITTARILADKALGNHSAQSCVDWAVEMLVQGHDGHYLTMLASMSSPLNDFEIDEYRDRALKELQIEEISQAEAFNLYAAEQLRSAYEGETDLLSALCNAKDMCVASGYANELYDFYLLYFAYSDLQHANIQHYWDGADRHNIDRIVRDRIHVFLTSLRKT